MSELSFLRYYNRFRHQINRDAAGWAWGQLVLPALIAVAQLVLAVLYGAKPEWRQSLMPIFWITIVPFFLWVFVHVVRTPWKLDLQVQSELAAVKRELSEIKDGAPKLVCKGVSFHANRIVRSSVDAASSPMTVTRTVIGVPVFYHLRIANEPTGMADRKVAEKVAARVQLFREDGTPAASERLHRWEDSPGPAEAGKMADRLLPLDIPPSGVEYKLDIAMKDDRDEAFYTPNNETVLRGSPDWKEEDFEFPPGTYIAEIHLRGTNIASNLRCRIVNKGKGTKLDITPLS